MSEGKSRVRDGILAAPHLQVIEGGGEKNAVPAVPGRGNGGGDRNGGAAADTPTPEGTCPLVPLGHRDGQFVFLDIKGQERRLSARSLGSRADLVSLFVGDTAWLFRWFPRKQMVKTTDADGNEVMQERIVGFNVAQASELLMALCGDAGLFGEHVVRRGPGVWTDEDGSPIVHAGDRVLFRGVWRPSGFRFGDQVWISHPATPRPGGRDEDGALLVPRAAGFAAGAAAAQEIQGEIRRLWSFRHDGSDIMAIGLMAIGYYGAAARWRPNGYLIGGTGSGKSLLLALLRACVPAHSYTTDTTKSGIESAINGKPTIAFIDEAGDRKDQHAAQTLLDMVLSASGADGTVGLRGTSDGRGRDFQVLCSVIMAAVNPPDMGPQHRDRISIIPMVKPAAGVDHRAAMEAAARRAQQLAPLLWGRAIEGWPRWLAARDAFREALSRAQCAAREMDQMGAILAGWWVMTQDGIPDSTAAMDGVGAVGDYIRGAAEVRGDDGPRRLVQLLASSLIQRDRSTDVEQIGVLVDKAFSGDPADEGPAARRLLERNGIRPIREAEDEDRQGRKVPRGAPGDGIWFGEKVKTLRDLLKGSEFEGDRWVYELMRLDGAKDSRPRNVRIGGVSGPAIWITRADWDPPDG